MLLLSGYRWTQRAKVTGAFAPTNHRARERER
jgi:hypothetical protein